MYRSGAATSKATLTFDNIVSRGHMAHKKQYISAFSMPVASKLIYEAVVYDKVPPQEKSHDSLISWSREVTRQIERDISLHLRHPGTPNLTESWLIIRNHHPKSHLTL